MQKTGKVKEKTSDEKNVLQRLNGKISQGTQLLLHSYFVV
jgi:hypothetical protein